MPRKRKDLIMLQRQTVKRNVVMRDRLCFSKDGIYSGDGQYRWWKEFDDSGYGWDGHFDIISKEQLIERMKCAETINIHVFQKFEPTDSPEGFDYELALVEDFVK
jgi:hypothetical protein